jgi:exopolysaccharide biosynthesis polyprenyl glycosylphosphotransferase
VITQKRVRLIGLFLVSDVLGVVSAFFYSYAFRFYAYIIPVDPVKGVPPLASYIATLPLFLGLHIFIFYLQGFYRTRLKRTKFDDFILITLNALLTILLALAILNYLYAYSTGSSPLFRITFKLSHGFLAVYFVTVILLVSFLRNQIYFFMKRRYAKGLNLQNVLIVGAGEMGRTVAQKIVQYKDLGFVLKGFLDNERPPGSIVDIDGGIKILGPVGELGSVLETEDIQDVYVALDLSNYAQILETLKIVHKYTVRVRLIPDLFQLLTLKANIQDLGGIPVISIDDVALRGGKLMLKRLIDLCASALLLVVLSPLFLAVGLIIKLTSRGSIFYKQLRVGLDGKEFELIKFRTMISNAEKDSGPVMCRPGDERMTRFGRFLRKYSIDEFPQLVNVFRGEMSLIGPRPERPFFVKDFREKIPKYMLRHRVKAGITGWAQVHGLRQETSIEKRLEYDFYYIQNWSLRLEMRILWMTLRKGFIDKSVK